MMKLRALVTVITGTSTFRPGSVFEVANPAEAETLIASGYAVEHREPKPEQPVTAAKKASKGDA